VETILFQAASRARGRPSRKRCQPRTRVKTFEKASPRRRAFHSAGGVGRLRNRGRDKQSFFPAAILRLAVARVKTIAKALPTSACARARVKTFEKLPPLLRARVKICSKASAWAASRAREDSRESPRFVSIHRASRTLVSSLSLPYDTAAVCFGKHEIMWAYPLSMRFPL
jgi:hypothetical protein